MNCGQGPYSRGFGGAGGGGFAEPQTGLGFHVPESTRALGPAHSPGFCISGPSFHFNALGWLLSKGIAPWGALNDTLLGLSSSTETKWNFRGSRVLALSFRAGSQGPGEGLGPQAQDDEFPGRGKPDRKPSQSGEYHRKRQSWTDC